MRDGSSARSFAKLAVGMMVNRGALALVALLPAPLLHAATASIEGNVVQVLATGDGRFGGCMAALDVAPADSGLDCAGRWVTFSCTGEHAEKEDAHRMFESLLAAVVADKSVEMWVTDEKKHGEYCHASRIKIQDDPHVDEDSDGDGVLDLDDDVPLNASETVDTDDDGVGDNTDTDDDNDGVSDADDAFPLDANESVDTDGDGVGDNADTDDDNDGTLDVDDDCPLDPDDNYVRADLTVESPSVSDSNLNAGASFTFSATVRNEGAGQAAATTLRYYRSTDATITTGDTEVGTDAVAALAASGFADKSIDLTAPDDPGTYYYGACVDTVEDESNANNNCSLSVAVMVVSGGETADDHGNDIDSATSVSVPSNTDGELEEGGDRDYFRVEVAQATTLTVETTGSTDTLGTLFDADEESLETNDDGGSGTNFLIERAVEPGTHYVEVRGYNDSSTGAYELRVSATDGGGGGAPDLVVESPSVSESDVEPGASFTLSATVRNGGDGEAAATTLRYYRSTDATITTGDTEVGTDAVSALAASAASVESISLTAPSSAGTYYYGACVGSVSGESDTTNNCSSAVRVTVGGDAAVTHEFTQCSGRVITFGSVLVTIRGTVQAHRSVTSVYVTGTANDRQVRRLPLGSISAGDSKNYTMIGTITTYASTLRCGVSVEWRELR